MLYDREIRNLKPTNKVQRFTDYDGLTLEVRPSGKKVFTFRFQWNKKAQTITIGRYPMVSLSDARQKVIEYRTQIENGIDPRIKKDTTFRSVAESWHKKNQGKWKPVTSKKHYKSLTRDIYPTLGNKLIDDITKVDILEVIKPFEINGYHDTAHRIFARLKDIFEYAVGSSLTENYPFIGLKKVLAVKPKAVNQPAVSSSEAHELLDKIETSNASRINKIYIKLLAHLFTRPSELRLAQWCEFDLKNAEWHIPTDRMKMAAPHWVPLSPQVIALIKELRLLTGYTPYLFNTPSGKAHMPISETSARKLIHKTGYKGKHTLHGFRSLASSVLHEQSNFRSDAIEAQLAHKVQGVRGVYLRADFKTERRELMIWYSDWLVTETCNLNKAITGV